MIVSNCQNLFALIAISLMLTLKYVCYYAPGLSGLFFKIEMKSFPSMVGS